MFHPDGIAGEGRSITEILNEIHQALNGNNPAYTVFHRTGVLWRGTSAVENSGRTTWNVSWTTSSARRGSPSKRPGWMTWSARNSAIIYSNDCQIISGFRVGGCDGIRLPPGEGNSAAIYSMTKSYLVAFAAITILMIVLIGNWKTGRCAVIFRIFCRFSRPWELWVC